MRPWAKLLSGVASFAPLVSAVATGVVGAVRLILEDVETGALGREPVDAILNRTFDTTDLVIFGVIVLGIVLLELALLVVFTVHAARDPRLEGGAIALWVLGFFLVGLLALPLYFVLYVLREPVKKVDLPEFP